MTKLDPADLRYALALGDAIVALSYYFCGVDILATPPPGGVLKGRAKDDAVYRAATEGRDGPGDLERAHYSSCGDQLHAILERLGVRNEPWVNRKSLGHYRPGCNIVNLHKPTCPIAIDAPRAVAYRPPAGSLCLIWTTGNDAHAFVVLGDGSDPAHIRTGNYGAGGMNAALSPGANVADSPYLTELSPYDGSATGRHLIGGSHRVLQSVITPEAIVPYVSAQIDLSGAPVTDELIDALGARYE